MDLKKQNPNSKEMRECFLAIKNNELTKLAGCVEKYGVNAVHNNGTLLHQAVFQNNFEAVKYLLDAGADPNALYDNTITPLIAAIDNKQWDMARLLVERGADINLKDAYHNSPLSKAIFHYSGDTGFLEMLLRRGSDPYQNLVNGYTPMDLAKSMKLANMIQTFIDKYQSEKGTSTR